MIEFKKCITGILESYSFFLYINNIKQDDYFYWHNSFPDAFVCVYHNVNKNIFFKNHKSVKRYLIDRYLKEHI
jgi:hypothetical protein